MDYWWGMYKLHIVSVSPAVEAGHLTHSLKKRSLHFFSIEAKQCTAVHRVSSKTFLPPLRRLSPISYMQQNNKLVYMSVENVLVFVMATL